MSLSSVEEEFPFAQTCCAVCAVCIWCLLFVAILVNVFRKWVMLVYVVKLCISSM